jgi:hypothetical protein
MQANFIEVGTVKAAGTFVKGTAANAAIDCFPISPARHYEAFPHFDVYILGPLTGFGGLSRAGFVIRTQHGHQHLLPYKSICQAGSQGHNRRQRACRAARGRSLKHEP